MKRAALLAAFALVSSLLTPAVDAAGAAPAYAARIVNPVNGRAIDVVTVDPEGAFLFEDVPAGWFRLEVSDADDVLQSAVSFHVPLESAPGRFRGRIAFRAGADPLLRLEGHVSSMADADVRVAAGYPHLPRSWDLGWRDDDGWLVVTIHGRGKEHIGGIALSSGREPLPAEQIEFDVPGREVRAYFRKRDLLASLVPAAARRWETLEIQIGVTTPADTQYFSRTIRLVGGR